MTPDVPTRTAAVRSPGQRDALDRTRQPAVAPARAGDDDPPALLGGLRQLVHLRTIAITGQSMAVVLALWLGVDLEVIPMAIIIAGLAVLNVLDSARLKRGTPATHHEVAVHLALDLAAFSGLLLLAGGAANPFSLLYLLHVVLIAMLLPWRQALVGTAVVVASFAVAFRFAEPLRDIHGEHLSDALMTFGLCAGFLLTVAATAWFILRIASSLREHDRLLAEAARRALNDEAVIRIGTLAAGAAHELGTPLTTMAVVVGEMRRDADTPARRRDVEILAAQIDACRNALADLRAVAGHARSDGGGPARLDAFLASTVARFQAMRPEVVVQARWEGAEAPEIYADESLGQAILILLNNAADASPHHVAVEARWDHESLHLTVADRGGGVPERTLERLGRAFFTTKPPGKGTGVGLVLTSSTVDRLGGTVRWSNRTDGGLAAEVLLPLNSLTLTVPSR